MNAASPATSGRRELVSRWKAHWWFKVLALPSYMTLFFAGYFLVLRSPSFSVTVMPLTLLDRWVPFWPGALPLYISLWVYVSVVFLLLRGPAELVGYCGAVIALSVAGLASFFLWPTAVPVPAVDWAGHPSFAFLKTVDATGNACPSLHVAFALFSACWWQRLLREMNDRGWLRAVSWLWCLGIVYSTLATKQHVAVDAFAGIALGLAGAAVSFRWTKVTPPVLLRLARTV